MSENRRQFFRLKYPKGAGPKLSSAGLSLEVIDISEQGLCFQPAKNKKYSQNESFAGSLKFSDGESVLVFGSVRRVTEDSISVELRKPIPLRIIMAEQRLLIQKFPKRA
jgi:PilZ domain